MGCQNFLSKLILLCGLAGAAFGETGYDAWLRCSPIDDPNVRQAYELFPATVVALGSSPVLAAAQNELSRGVRGMLERTLRRQFSLSDITRV